jgi:hypothetical protein
VSTTLPLYAPAKPEEFAPCNGCGVCCASEVCKVGIAVHGDVLAPCPSLVHHDGRFWCDVVQKLEGTHTGERLKRHLGIGMCCDADLPAGYSVNILRRIVEPTLAGAKGDQP